MITEQDKTGENRDRDISITDTRSIIACLSEKYHIDFNHFALSAFRRRIGKFYRVADIRSTDRFVQRLTDDKLLFLKFLKAVNIPVTEFFRDPSFWRYFKNKLIPGFSDRKVRALFPNASTGEEMYTLLIILKEEGLLDKINIVATEMHELMFNPAQKGVYTHSELTTSEDNYKRYKAERDNLNLKKDLKGLDFDLSSHYLEIDGDETKLDRLLLEPVQFRVMDWMEQEIDDCYDWVFARNIGLVYNAPSQTQLMLKFHKALKENGLIFLGLQESLDGMGVGHLFELVNEEFNVYRKA